MLKILTSFQFCGCAGDSKAQKDFERGILAKYQVTPGDLEEASLPGSMSIRRVRREDKDLTIKNS